MFAYEEARRGIVREESKLADLEAELRYLLGRFPKGVAQKNGTAARIIWFSNDLMPARNDENPMLERVRKPLAKPLSLEFFDQPLDDVLAYVHEVAGIPFVIQPVGLAEAGVRAVTV